MSERQSRRSFLGLLSAVSAALAAGVRLPDAPVAQAAETAPGDAPPPDRTPAGLLAMLRELLPQCVAVAWEQSFDAHGFETKVTYRSDIAQAALNRNPLGVDLASVEAGWPVSVDLRDTTPWTNGPLPDHGPQRVWCKAGPTTRELTIVWRGWR